MTASTTPEAGAAPAPHTPVEWAKVADLGDPAKAAATTAESPRALVATLADQGMHADAVRLLAHLLPKREAVWWAWSCAKAAAGTTPKPEVVAALAATERWITEPTDAHRRAAMDAANEADLATPAGLAGLAVFFSGGSVAPPEAPVTPPGPFLAAKAVSGAVILATVAGGGSASWHRAFLDLGVRVGQNAGLWPA
jgi:hypothetical protein